MDEGMAPRALEPRRPLEMPGTDGLAGLSADGSRDSLVMQVLSTEHFSLLTHRSLVYNEAFTRVGMFLTFVSMSFVALALLSGAVPIDQSFLATAAIVFGFDFIIGLTTFLRVGAANAEDVRVVQGMARIRHGYIELAPETQPYFTSGTYDDMAGVSKAYGVSRTPTVLANLTYGLSTSNGMAGFVVSLVGGVFAAVTALAIGVSGAVAFVIGIVAGLAVFALCVRWAFGNFRRTQDSLEVRFPSPPSGLDAT